MRRVIFFLLITLLIGISFSGVNFVNAATPTPSAWIDLIAPVGGEALQGVVPIVVEAKGGGMESIELAFAYPNDKTETWFVIATIDPEEGDAFQVEWDTTVITDGEYDLRLRVVYANNTLTKYASGLRVRNYTPIETPTPSPTETPNPTEENASPTVTALPSTPTPLPSNPAAVEKGDIVNALGLGLAVIAALFALLGIYAAIRKALR